MKKQLLFCVLLGSLASCAQETDVKPDAGTLSGEVSGIYRTNAFVNPSCVSIAAGQMPIVTLHPESEGAVSLVYSSQSPVSGSQQLTGVQLSRQADSAILLRLGNVVLGSVQIDRVFTNNGMEKQGRLLRINADSSRPYFAGVKE